MSVRQVIRDILKIKIAKRLFTLLLAACWPGAGALADTGQFSALSTPAITVKAPANVVLIAIARAGNRIVAAGEHGVICYSDDNGISWTQARVPVDVTLTTIAFANKDDGWAAGHDGVILHTTDGGANWVKQLDGFTANTLMLAAAQQAVATNDPSPGTPLAMKRANYFMSKGPDQPFLSLTVESDDVVFAFGAYRMAVVSRDGGAHWTDWSLHVDDPISHNIYDSLILPWGTYLVGEAGVVFRSTDQEQNFSQMTSPSATTLFTVLPAGNNGVFVGGVAGQAYRSADGGKSWSVIHIGTQSNITAGLVLSSGVLIIASEEGGLFESSDSAASFRQLTQVAPMALYGLVQAANGDLIAVGDHGVARFSATDFLNH